MPLAPPFKPTSNRNSLLNMFQTEYVPLYQVHRGKFGVLVYLFPFAEKRNRLQLIGWQFSTSYLVHFFCSYNQFLEKSSIQNTKLLQVNIQNIYIYHKILTNAQLTSLILGLIDLAHNLKGLEMSFGFWSNSNKGVNVGVSLSLRTVYILQSLT